LRGQNNWLEKGLYGNGNVQGKCAKINGTGKTAHFVCLNFLGCGTSANFVNNSAKMKQKKTFKIFGEFIQQPISSQNCHKLFGDFDAGKTKANLE